MRFFLPTISQGQHCLSQAWGVNCQVVARAWAENSATSQYFGQKWLIVRTRAYMYQVQFTGRSGNAWVIETVRCIVNGVTSLHVFRISRVDGPRTICSAVPIRQSSSAKSVPFGRRTHSHADTWLGAILSLGVARFTSSERGTESRPIFLSRRPVISMLKRDMHVQGRMSLLSSL